MIAVILGWGIGLVILLFVERLHKHGHIRLELARKIIHLVSGLILVVWSFFIAWQTIILMEVTFFALAMLTRWFKLFDSQRTVNRISWGEFFFPIGVVLSIFLGAPRWVFILAILHLAVADAAAALVGEKYGRSNSYRVFGQKKSVAGTAAFFVVSMILISATFLMGPSNLTATTKSLLLCLPVLTTIAENLGVYGTDNLIIPLVVVLLLS